MKNAEKVILHGEEYLFMNRIGENQELLASFNALASKNFGISFSSVGGEYEPHVLIQGNKVCSNISVNQIPFMVHGQRKFYIQLGTVMTDEEYRHKGLSRWLMENIIEEWKDKSDQIYLFANDTVLEFYPKFGFQELQEYEYRITKLPNTVRVKMEQLDMKQETSVKLICEKYKEGNQFSEISMIENRPIFEFYYQGLIQEQVYYMKEYGVTVVAGEEDGELICFDILGKTNASLSEILTVIAAHFSQKEVVLGFSPVQKEGMECRLHKEEDTTLFMHRSGERIMAGEKLMFPILSHA